MKKKKKHLFPDNRAAAFVLASGPKSAPCPPHPSMADVDEAQENPAASASDAAPDNDDGA